MSLYRAHQAGEHVHDGILQILWTYHERVRQKGNTLGSLLPYKQKVVVPETKGDHSIFKSSSDKATSRRRHVETKLRHYAGLGFGLWSCSTTTNSAPRDDDGEAWYSVPEYIYQRHCIRSDQSINITFEEADQDEEHAPESEGSGEDSQTEGQAIGESGSEPEYDESGSDEDEVGASDESGNYLQGEIGSSTTFLLGARSRFDRAIRFNNRLIQ